MRPRMPVRACCAPKVPLLGCPPYLDSTWRSPLGISLLLGYFGKLLMMLLAFPVTSNVPLPRTRPRRPVPSCPSLLPVHTHPSDVSNHGGKGHVACIQGGPAACHLASAPCLGSPSCTGTITVPLRGALVVCEMITWRAVPEGAGVARGGQGAWLVLGALSPVPSGARPRGRAGARWDPGPRGLRGLVSHLPPTLVGKNARSILLA